MHEFGQFLHPHLAQKQILTHVHICIHTDAQTDRGQHHTAADIEQAGKDTTITKLLSIQTIKQGHFFKKIVNCTKFFKLTYANYTVSLKFGCSLNQ